MVAGALGDGPGADGAVADGLALGPAEGEADGDGLAGAVGVVAAAAGWVDTMGAIVIVAATIATHALALNTFTGRRSVV